jgi:ABC-type uncharacterized transport system permease subunit
MSISTFSEFTVTSQAVLTQKIFPSEQIKLTEAWRRVLSSFGGLLAKTPKLLETGQPTIEESGAIQWVPYEGRPSPAYKYFLGVCEMAYESGLTYVHPAKLGDLEDMPCNTAVYSYYLSSVLSVQCAISSIPHVTVIEAGIPKDWT